jgi:hypothetical protein
LDVSFDAAGAAAVWLFLNRDHTCSVGEVLLAAVKPKNKEQLELAIN